ncbi:Alpha/beta hydrolase family-domain-containing protein [Multifurca ochricompacta]|uniref:Alpha/beta hydrolase family-domain-containing protein n=1 Tax=Multifurca ochricompacta TaxID=376703 RepID=A0AAD4M2L2_9AGAM|nr:Alpha/beta hydrolase family-domain-containing protein [Multifurca ochricompacta]
MSHHHTIPKPRQPSPVEVNERVQPSPLLPIRDPPEPLRYPELPCPPRDHHFTSAYTVTTHLIPAAFPRNSPFVPLPETPHYGNKVERSAYVERYTNDLLALQAQHHPDDSGTQSRVLWNVLNRYVRTDKLDGLTLLMLHANGLHKETFEPTLRHLLQAVDEDKQYRIDEVWALDAVQHGDSGLVNAQNLGALFFWSDHARDILNFVLNFLPEEVTPSSLPTCIPRVPSEISEERKKRGLTNRKLVVVGHSLGGCAATLAVHSIPAPFSGLVLIDPVIVPSSFDQSKSIRNYVVGALARRNVWPTREEALSLLSKSPFFGAWDPDVLRRYIDYALNEDSSGQIRLKCTTIQEASVFADGTRRKEAWSALSQIDNKIAVKWLVPLPEASVLGSYELMQETVWRRPENASNSLISKATHLVVQDSPREVGKLCFSLNVPDRVINLNPCALSTRAARILTEEFRFIKK